MITLVIGANSSGKSAYSEKLAVAANKGGLIYLATMIPYGIEGKTRVDKHRRQRSGMEFRTLELPYGVDKVEVSKDDTVLLEDVSNLVANIMFEKKDMQAAKTALEELVGLAGKCDNLIVITIEGASVEDISDSGTCDYVEALNHLNEELYDLADIVVRMVEGMPHTVKKEMLCI